MIRLPRVKQQIFDCLRRGPRTITEIKSWVWQIHPQDAPCDKCIAVHISAMRRMLAREYEIICARGGGLGRGQQPYVLRPLKMERSLDTRAARP